jgi:hypothetical protein
MRLGARKLALTCFASTDPAAHSQTQIDYIHTDVYRCISVDMPVNMDT